MWKLLYEERYLTASHIIFHGNFLSLRSSNEYAILNRAFLLGLMFRSFDMNIPKLSDPLDPWLTPHSQAASTLIPVSKPSLGIQDSSLSRMIELEKKQKSQVAAMQQSEKLHNFFVGSSESDSLPFAIDGESGNGQDVPCDDGCGLGSYGAVVNSGGPIELGVFFCYFSMDVIISLLLRMLALADKPI